MSSSCPTGRSAGLQCRQTGPLESPLNGLGAPQPAIVDQRRLGEQIITRIRDLSVRLDAFTSRHAAHGDERTPLTT